MHANEVEDSEEDPFDDKVYQFGQQSADQNDVTFGEIDNQILFIDTENVLKEAGSQFHDMLEKEEQNDQIIRFYHGGIKHNRRINYERLKLIRNQSRTENELLTKAGRPIIPATLRQSITIWDTLMLKRHYYDQGEILLV